MSGSPDPKPVHRQTQLSSYPMVEQTDCKHTPSPDGYIQWHAWAEKKAKTHRQERCPICGLWAIWKPKRKAAE